MSERDFVGKMAARLETTLHPTVCREGILKNPIFEAPNYKCQFCSKMGEYAYVVAHMQTHEKTAVKHGGYKMYRCHGGCCRSHHYHCCYLQYSWYAVMEAPFDFTIHDMPCLRRWWWCTMLVENLEIEGHGRRFAHFTKQGIQMARGCLDPIFRIPRKRKYDEVTMEPVPLKPCKVKEPCRVESSPEGIGILQLPEEILHMISILVVLQDGDPAIRTLALTCTRFWRIVREESFLKEPHFCWLDSVVNWNSFSEDHRRTYRITYLISRCIQCNDMYKDCEGYWGCGQRGKLQGFYSENDFAGYCNMDCFYAAGGTV